jgi:hypothetical protein
MKFMEVMEVMKIIEVMGAMRVMQLIQGMNLHHSLHIVKTEKDLKIKGKSRKSKRAQTRDQGLPLALVEIFSLFLVDLVKFSVYIVHIVT